MIITSTGTTRRALTAQESNNVKDWLAININCLPKEITKNTWLSIKMYFEYDEKLSDKQISTLKRIYRYRTEKLDIRDSHIQASQMSSR